MKRGQWDAKAQGRIVLEGLQGRPVAELCHEPQISQSQYDQWRGHFFANASEAFETHQDAQKDAHMARENTRLKTLVGELTLEFKKSDEWLG